MSASVSASATGSDPPSFQFTKDAIEHEHAVLLHILREEGLADDWAGCLEGALIEMSNVIESRGWMEGIRKAREEEILDEEEKERWDPEARLADINRAILAVTKSGSQQEKKDGPKHLVLTISSPSTFVPTIRDASGARVANRYACKFEAGTWTLPRFVYDNKVMGHGGEMILGLAEWRSVLPRYNRKSTKYGREILIYICRLSLFGGPPLGTFGPIHGGGWDYKSRSRIVLRLSPSSLIRVPAPRRAAPIPWSSYISDFPTPVRTPLATHTARTAAVNALKDELKS